MPHPGEDGTDCLSLSTAATATTVQSLEPADDAQAADSGTGSKSTVLNCKDILRIIFEKLPIFNLARAACVCRMWYALASDGEIQVSAFKAPWKIKEVIGSPSSGSFWRDSSLARFAISHRIVRGDSVASLAVKYSVQVTEIKRLNNMMSDHGIYSRDRLLIPVSDPDFLIHKTCYIELDRNANREVAVVYLDGGEPKNIDGINKSGGFRVENEIVRRRVIESLRRSMHVDDETAQYYFSVSNGNLRAAISEFSQDLDWESGSRLQ